jgi:16S rRNA (uracil1498-N3)-methyltransferase
VTLAVFVVPTEALAADAITLDGDEGRHAVVVKRIRVGEQIVLTDGCGQAAECRVTSLGKQSLVAEALVRRFEPRREPQLVVVQAIPKGDHAERAVDLLTEVGVDVIVPWAAARNVVTWKGDRAEKALHRWRATATAAAKQSRRLWHPEVTDLRSTGDVVQLMAGAAASFVLDESATQGLSGVPLPVPEPGFVRPSAESEHEADPDESRDGGGGEVVLVVGPEGGITDEELAAFADAGAVLVRLGPEVLRSSSAGMVAAAVILSRTPRWS